MRNFGGYPGGFGGGGFFWPIGAPFFGGLLGGFLGSQFNQYPYYPNYPNYRPYPPGPYYGPRRRPYPRYRPY
ncbi:MULTISPECIES: uroporphyrin-III methyltransferase [unclassified Lysinibacillus]|uniref:uroporphyrin-III methyltransferase n=1 Tax=unclassified Lysinibacillus TaxID=2636778 RepID=UPI00381A7A9F